MTNTARTLPTSDAPGLPLYWHRDIALHDQAAEHVAMHEQRLGLIADHLVHQPWALPVEPPVANLAAMERVHATAYLDVLADAQNLPPGQHLAFDNETRANRHTWRTLALSAGGWLEATRAALQDGVPAAFCVGYAGHHARQSRAAGFCFVNGVAVATQAALALGANRVAVLDFDTHAGDGTVLSVLNDPRVLFAETYQAGFPGEFLSRPTRDGIWRFLTKDPSRFKPNWEFLFRQILAFQPEVVLVSAGFDAHAEDPLTRIGVDDATYTWLGQQLTELPCPVVCGLEGGYNLDSTRRSAALFCAELAKKR